MKKISLLLLVAFLLCVPVISFAEVKNLLANPGFEEIANGGPAGWYQNVWDKNDKVTELKVDDTEKHSGSKSLLVINNSVNDARFVQDIKVDENSYYKLSCYVKTENVGNDKKGANISVVGLGDTSNDIKGTSNSWQYIEMYGKTNKGQSNLQVSVGLGGYNSTNTGKAWFDDVTVEKLDAAPSGVAVSNLFRADDSSSSNQNNSQSQNNQPVVDASKTAYANPLVAYFIIFLIVFIVLFILVVFNKISLPAGMEKVALIVLLLIGIVFRIIIAPRVEGFAFDVGCFKGWSMAAARDFIHIYNKELNGNMFIDYPPAYIFVLYLIGKVNQMQWLGIDFTLLVKLPSLIADVVTGYLIYRMAKKYFKPEVTLLLAAAYILNPMTFVDSALWGQVDSFFTMLVVFAVMFIADRKVVLSSVFFMAALLMKPQGLFFMPVLALELFFIDGIRDRNFMNIIKAIAASLVTAVVFILPFSFSQKSNWIIELYSNTGGQYDYASLNAFNLFALLGANLKNGSLPFIGFSYNTWGLIFDVLVGAFCFFLYFKGYKKNAQMLPAITALILNCGAFMLSSKMHERYMFPAVAFVLMCLVFAKDRRWFAIFASLTLTVFYNIHIVLYRMIAINYPHINPDDMGMLVLSFINVITFVYLIKVSYDTVVRNKFVPLFVGAKNLKNKVNAKDTVAKASGIKTQPKKK